MPRASPTPQATPLAAWRCDGRSILPHPPGRADRDRRRPACQRGHWGAGRAARASAFALAPGVRLSLSPTCGVRGTVWDLSARRIESTQSRARRAMAGSPRWTPPARADPGTRTHRRITAVLPPGDPSDEQSCGAARPAHRPQCRAAEGTPMAPSHRGAPPASVAAAVASAIAWPGPAQPRHRGLRRAGHCRQKVGHNLRRPGEDPGGRVFASRAVGRQAGGEAATG